MSSSPLPPDLQSALKRLFKLVSEYIAAESVRQQRNLQDQILDLFSQFGVASDSPAVREAADFYELIRRGPRTRVLAEPTSGRVIPLISVAYAALVRWASRFPEAKPEDYMFPSCEAAGIEREHPDLERIDASRPVKSGAPRGARFSSVQVYSCVSTISATPALPKLQRARPASKS